MKKNTAAFTIGIIGLILGSLFAISVLINDFTNDNFLAKESILVFTIWAVVGLIYYAVILKLDNRRKFGNSMVALFGLLILIIYSIGSWLFKSIKERNDNSIRMEIILSAVILLATQVVCFFVFSLVKKREIALQRKLVIGMATMVEGRDNSTGGHIKRTSEVVKFIVEEMMKDPLLSANHNFYNYVIQAAPMHDLGKIAIDDIILRKPGKFTPEEYAIMKRHSPEGAKIVEEILKDTLIKNLKKYLLTLLIIIMKNGMEQVIQKD